MFFLITYMVINVVLLAESSLGLMSFRPTLQLPRVVPLIGALGCLFVMFIINPTFLQDNNLNLALLMAIRLSKAWRAELNLICVVTSDDQVDQAAAHIHELRDLCRIGVGATTRVMVGDFRACVGKAPQSDMDVPGIKQGPDLAFVAEMVEATRSSCMFAADSGLESALAWHGQELVQAAPLVPI